MKLRATKFMLLLTIAWIVMTLTHEGGHLIGGMVSGAKLREVDLAPWRLPYSIHSPDPHPLITLWSGPIFGAIAPVIVALFIRKRWAWFIADFCLLANGSYLALAWVAGDRFLDTPRLIESGSHPVTIVIYCATTIGFGYVFFAPTVSMCSLPQSPLRTLAGEMGQFAISSVSFPGLRKEERRLERLSR